MKVKVTHEIDDQRVMDLLSGHAMRYSDWVLKLEGNFNDGYKVTFDLETDNEGDGNGHKQVGYLGIARGLARMASDKEGSKHWADFLADNDDDITCDAAWQFICLGRMVYG